MMPVLPKNNKLFLGIVLSILCFCAVVVFFFNRQQERTKRVACQNNLRTIGQAIGMYVSDNDGFLPTEAVWGERAIPSLPVSGCPAAEQVPHLDPPLRGSERGLRGYAFNAMLIGHSKVVDGRPISQALTYASLTHPHTTLAVFDYTSGMPSAQMLDIYQGQRGGWPKQLAQGWKRHGNGGNYLFCDGHVGWFPESAILVSVSEICDVDKTKPHFCVE